LQEKPLQRQAPAPLPAGGLLRIRWAERHEEMRERSDYFAVQHGHPPIVLLVPLASARAAAVRLGFAGDLLRRPASPARSSRRLASKLRTRCSPLP